MRSRFILYIVCCLFFTNCSFNAYEFPAILYVTNNSSKSVGLYLGVDSMLPLSDYPIKKGICPGEMCVLYGSGDDMKNVVQNIGCSYLTVLVFDMDTLDTYTWNEIVGGHKVWQEIELPVETVKNCGTFINIWD